MKKISSYITKDTSGEAPSCHLITILITFCVSSLWRSLKPPCIYWLFGIPPYTFRAPGGARREYWSCAYGAGLVLLFCCAEIAVFKPFSACKVYSDISVLEWWQTLGKGIWESDYRVWLPFRKRQRFLTDLSSQSLCYWCRYLSMLRLLSSLLCESSSWLYRAVYSISYTDRQLIAPAMVRSLCRVNAAWITSFTGQTDQHKESIDFLSCDK